MVDEKQTANERIGSGNYENGPERARETGPKPEPSSGQQKGSTGGAELDHDAESVGRSAAKPTPV